MANKSRIRNDGIAIAASQVTSGVLAIGRMLAAAAGLPVQVNAAGDALESVPPSIAVTPANLPALTPSPQAILQVALPVAGTYLIESRVRVPLNALTATRNITFLYNVSAGFVSMALQLERLLLTTWSVQAAISSNGGGAAASVTSGGSRVTQFATGPLVVNAPGTLTINAMIDGDSPVVDSGCFLRATRIA